MTTGIDPTFPYGGGSDNPGGTLIAGHGVQTETGDPTFGDPRRLSGGDKLGRLQPLSGGGSDYTGVGAVPAVGGDAYSFGEDDPEGVEFGRVAGQDETAGDAAAGGPSPDHFPGQ